MSLKYILSCVFSLLLVNTAPVAASTLVHSPLVQEVQSRADLVKELQDYELYFGFVPTNNFKIYQENLESYTLCFFADVFSFEVTYAGEGSDCAFDERTRDVYKYTVEAQAGIKTPLTRDLVNASLARFIMVVFHEDFHEQMIGVPTWAINESATTLVGLLLAREFALEKYGAMSIVFRELDTDIVQYFEVVRIEEHHAAALSVLYGSVARGEITKERGFQAKEKLFSEMRNSCKTLSLRTMAGCGALTNNANFGVAFKYAQYYRLFFDLYKTCGEDVRKTVLVLSALAHEQLTEEVYVHRVSQIVSKELICP